MALERSVLDLDWVRSKALNPTEAGLPVDPTGFSVQMAFKAPGTNPGTTDWQSAAWETNATTTPDTYYARCLVGPGGTIALSVGTYIVWVKVLASPEIPVMKSGKLVVF